MAWEIRGLIEGFYGRPWSWDDRVEVMRWCAARGMTHYVYAPKDDPKHRERWRDLYDEAELDGFRRLQAEGDLGVGFAISPGLSIDYGAEPDRTALAAKVDQVLEVGIDLVCLALDDIPVRPGLGEDQAGLTDWLHGHLAGRARLLLVPTEYVGTRSTPYLRALAERVPDDVAIAWTGRAVVNDEITAAQARGRADALGGRAPLVWDNYPVNDAVMNERLYVGPLRGRDPALAEVCCGYLANPMVQPRASMLPLSSVAAYLRGDDPVAAWAAEADELGLRVFAEACDGLRPQELVAALADEGGGMGWSEPAERLARWLEVAAGCKAPGLEEEVADWEDQVHVEAEVALSALRAIQASRPVLRVDAEGHGQAAPPDPEAALLHLFTAVYGWRRLRRAKPAVMGLRFGFRPAMGQRDDGHWVMLPEALQEDENAVDHLCRLALGHLSDDGTLESLRVTVDGADVDVDHDGAFLVKPGSTVLASAGAAATRLRAPGVPPLPDPRV